MSGTSLDGVDAALGPRVLGTIYRA